MCPQSLILIKVPVGDAGISNACHSVPEVQKKVIGTMTSPLKCRFPTLINVEWHPHMLASRVIRWSSAYVGLVGEQQSSSRMGEYCAQPAMLKRKAASRRPFQLSIRGEAAP
jgi:hypothetical protein